MSTTRRSPGPSGQERLRRSQRHRMVPELINASNSHGPTILENSQCVCVCGINCTSTSTTKLKHYWIYNDSKSTIYPVLVRIYGNTDLRNRPSFTAETIFKLGWWLVCKSLHGEPANHLISGFPLESAGGPLISIELSTDPLPTRLASTVDVVSLDLGSIWWSTWKQGITVDWGEVINYDRLNMKFRYSGVHPPGCYYSLFDCRNPIEWISFTLSNILYQNLKRLRYHFYNVNFENQVYVSISFSVFLSLSKSISV